MLVCPVCLVKADGAIPARIVPISKSLRRFAGGHIEKCATLGEVLAHIVATDSYGLNPDTLVLRVTRPVGVSCGSEAVYCLHLAQHEVSRL